MLCIHQDPDDEGRGLDLSRRIVVITGATSGLGLATAILLAERGAEVVMVGRDRTRANFTRTEIAQYASGSEPIVFSQTCRRRRRSIAWPKSSMEVCRGSMS